MIESVDLTKRFDDVTAVDHVNAVIAEGSVFGLVGTNGAGKSTFLRLVTGILKPDEGRVLIDGEDVFTVPRIREQFFYVPDDQYFFSNVTPREMMAFFAKIYPHFDRSRFGRLAGAFELPENRKINTFSKGMKKQLSIILGLSAGTKYLLCDETFDGLDPVMRQAVKSLFAEDMTERGLTPVITSHNLRELEDICDHVGLLHKGGTDPLNVLRIEQRGSILTLTVRGSEYELLGRMEQLDTVFYEVVPLSLEEIFISETEVTGYDIKKLLF